MKMRSLFITTASFALTTAVVTNAWIQKKQFYPTVVYLTKSSPCIAVLYIQVFVFVFLFAKLLRKIFFGQLRPAETEHLIERSWYAITDTCLAFTMFRDDFSPMFVASFSLLLFLKCFHWLIEDRVDYMERSPIITSIFKLRVLSLLAILLACDISFVNLSYRAVVTKGASVQLVFGFEYAILATIIMTVFLKYVLHAIDLQSENPWENKAVYMLYVELVTGFLRVLLYLCFTVLMVKVHTFPLFSIRPMYLTMRQFKKAMTDIVLSRRAIRNMNTLYPDATPEELSSTDRTCIICRDDMQAPDPDHPPAPGGVSDAGVNKKLPCGHIFHASCLRSWFQRQQTCPTCRLDVLQARTPAPPDRQAPPPPGAPQPPHPGNNPFGPMFHPMMFPRAPPPPPPANGSAPPPATPGSQSQSSPPPPPPPGSPFPMGMFMPPPFMPPPIPPPNFSGMSEEQIRLMEGQERRNVEARIECLRNINNLLDAAMQQVAQYVTVVQTLGRPGLQIPPMPSMPQTSTPVPTDPEQAAASSSTDVAGPSDANATATIRSTEEIAETTVDPDSLPPSEDSDDVPSDPTELRKRRLAKFTAKSSSESPEDNNEK